ncbi:MAG TPA: hypothetical protein VJL32_00725 [Candidatus Paceibacterota bacterium]
MDADRFIRTVPEEKWPDFLKAAKARAEREGISVQEFLDRDREAARRSTVSPDDEGGEI